MAQFKAETRTSAQVSKASESKELVSKTVVSKAALIEKMKRRDSEMVRGRFTYNEVPGGKLEFRYRRYKGIPVTFYSLTDGQVYSLPKGVANHLVKSGGYPVHEHSTDEFGKPLVRVSRMNKRYNFESLEFFDDMDNEEESRLYKVEKVLDTGSY